MHRILLMEPTRDPAQRNLKKKPDMTLPVEKEIDDAVDGTFPASDPPAWSSIAHEAKKHLSLDGIELLFTHARTVNAWNEKPVTEETIRQVYFLMKWGPTNGNSCPGRIMFVQSQAEREKLIPCLDRGNQEKTRTAPATAIIAYDVEFYEKLPKLVLHGDARSFYLTKSPEFVREAAFRSGTLQGGYFIMACRALGLDCGPMSGFSNAKIDDTFFKGTSWRSNFLCNFGYGDPSSVYPRAPRLDFEEACRIV